MYGLEGNFRVQGLGGLKLSLLTFEGVEMTSVLRGASRDNGDIPTWLKTTSSKLLSEPPHQHKETKIAVLRTGQPQGPVGPKERLNMCPVAVQEKLVPCRGL